MSDSRPVIGVDLGGTHMQVGVVDRSGRIVRREGKLTRAERGPAGVIAAIADAVREVAAHAGPGLSGIGAVGIGAPGAIDSAGTMVLEAPNIGWKNVPLQRLLTEALGGMPVMVDNDVNAAVLGENRFGAGKNAPDVVGVWVGTGIGGGIIRGGKVDRGPLGSAGEIGRMVLFPDLPIDQCQMEYHCSRMHVGRQIAEAMGKGKEVPAPPSASDMTGARMAEMYAANDPVARPIIDRSADLLGMSIGNVVTLLSIPVVVLGGGMAEALGTPYADRIALAARKWVFPRSLAPHIDLRLTELRENAGLLGAAALAMTRD